MDVARGVFAVLQAAQRAPGDWGVADAVARARGDAPEAEFRRRAADGARREALRMAERYRQLLRAEERKRRPDAAWMETLRARAAEAEAEAEAV